MGGVAESLLEEICLSLPPLSLPDTQGRRGFVKTLEWKDFTRKRYQRILFGAGLRALPCPA